MQFARVSYHSRHKWFYHSPKFYNFLFQKDPENPQIDDEDDEVFEEIEPPETDSKVKAENANSAFDNTAATFYVWIHK